MDLECLAIILGIVVFDYKTLNSSDCLVCSLVPHTCMVILRETSRLNVSIAPREQNRRILNRLNRVFFNFSWSTAKPELVSHISKSLQHKGETQNVYLSLGPSRSDWLYDRHVFRREHTNARRRSSYCLFNPTLLVYRNKHGTNKSLNSHVMLKVTNSSEMCSLRGLQRATHWLLRPFWGTVCETVVWFHFKNKDKMYITDESTLWW